MGFKHCSGWLGIGLVRFVSSKCIRLSIGMGKMAIAPTKGRASAAQRVAKKDYTSTRWVGVAQNIFCSLGSLTVC
ncbi:hypothetical protein B0H14DRAFT_3871727 [Mycena olivaceomarginata]|nr:hypothetical protein B0H14DRAFT_3871727 [Mycena olivaceomarginata]